MEEKIYHFWRKAILSLALLAVMSFALSIIFSGCAFLDSKITDIRGNLIGNSFNIDFFNNFGEKSLYVTGEKINLEPVIIDERVYMDGTWGKTETLSSVIKINIDGEEMLTCGDSVVFYETGLTPDYNFQTEDIESESNSFADNTIVAGSVNNIKNHLGKPAVIVVKSQMGSPIYAFSGDEVYWEVPDNLPKTTVFLIDGKRLYLHRTNFQQLPKSIIE